MINAASPPTFGASVDQAIDAIQRAYIAVFLADPDIARKKAGPAWQAAWDIQRWLNGTLSNPPSGTAQQQLDALVTKFKDASKDFADEAQRKLV